jgi:hypothetical protein
VDFTLLDWTRMGRVYCLAGVVADKNSYRVVRPLPKGRGALVRNVGWSPFLFDGRTRWENFELLGPEQPLVEPPHLEDLWVRALRPRKTLATSKQRRDILAATLAPQGEPLFGGPLVLTRGAAYLAPGTGRRSLVTIKLPARQISFTASYRDGAPEADFRVVLNMPDLEGRLVPVKDHHLLRKAQSSAEDLGEQVKVLNSAIQQMGDQVAVRLGLSRAFANIPQSGQNVCWLMADGFFSLADPQS